MRVRHIDICQSARVAGAYALLAAVAFIGIPDADVAVPADIDLPQNLQRAGLQALPTSLAKLGF